MKIFLKFINFLDNYQILKINNLVKSQINNKEIKRKGEKYEWGTNSNPKRDQN